jgi:hypothetical protein
MSGSSALAFASVFDRRTFRRFNTSTGDSGAARNGRPIFQSADFLKGGSYQMKAGLAPSSQFCAKRQQLLRAVSDAISEIVSLHTKQYNALQEGSSEYPEIETQIREAQRRKLNARRAYEQHLCEHGC